MSWIADYDTHGREFPTCVHVTKTTGTMTHGATYVPIEDGKAVRAENDKLRELVRGLEYCVQGSLCDCCPLYDPSGTNHRRCESLERELGIEVDE